MELKKRAIIHIYFYRLAVKRGDYSLVKVLFSPLAILLKIYFLHPSQKTNGSWVYCPPIKMFNHLFCEVDRALTTFATMNYCNEIFRNDCIVSG